MLKSIPDNYPPEEKKPLSSTKYQGKNENSYKFNANTKSKNDNFTVNVKGKSNSQYDVKKLLNLGNVNEKTQKLFSMYQTNTNIVDKKNFIKK